MASAPARSGQLQRPRLKVIPGGAAARTAGGRTPGVTKHRGRPSARLKFAVASAVMVCSLLFALVLLNIMVVQSSFKLADLQSSVLQEQADYRRMRYEIAQAESPARVAEAAGALGLRVPDRQEYIIGRPGSTPIKGLASSGEDAKGDGELKAVLGP